MPQPLIERVKASAFIGRLSSPNNARRDKTIIVGVGTGLRFDPGSSNPAYASGDNELPVQHALAQYLAPGGVLYDVGANVGFLTVIGARLVGAAGAVYAFEPVPSNAAFVRRNAELNEFRNVTVIEKAVSFASRKGELTLAQYSGGAVLSTIAAPPDAAGRLSIELVSIDDLVFRDRMRPPAMVKIDVEGAELEVLRGMSRTMRELKPIILYELDDAASEPLRRKREACEQFVHALGYRVSALEDSYPNLRWLVKHFVATPA